MPKSNRSFRPLLLASMLASSVLLSGTTFARDVVVRTEVRQPGAKAVQIDYNLEKLPEGWKVYDVLVAGVSLVTNYRDSFGQEVRAGGIDGLIKSLKDKNKQLETTVQAKK